jgi:hypothetical protein
LRGTGFLIKLEKSQKPLYCLMSNEHVIKKEFVSSKETLKIILKSVQIETEIILNKEERYIQDFKFLGIDAVIVKILENDKIPTDYFLKPNMDYQKGYSQFENKLIRVVEHPLEDPHFAIGQIKKIFPYQLWYEHCLYKSYI